MDPTSTAKPTLPPACREGTDSQAEIWEPPFERWQRLTESLIADADEPRIVSTQLIGAQKSDG